MPDEWTNLKTWAILNVGSGGEDELFALVNAIVKTEREACARIADEQAHHHAVYGALSDASIVNVVAEAIRSRSVRREQQDHRRRDE